MNKKLLIGGAAAVAVLGIGGFMAMQGPSDPCSNPDALYIVNGKVEIGESLNAYAQEWGAENDTEVCVRTYGGDVSYDDQLKAEFQSNNQPDIFLTWNAQTVADWSEVTYDMSGEAWVEETEHELVDENGTVVGQPIAIESSGWVVNDAMFEQVGLDPDEIDTYEEAANAVKVLDENKEELGIEAVFSMSTKETWLTGGNQFNTLLIGSGGQEAAEAYYSGDSSQLQDVEAYANMINVIYSNSVGDPATIGYDDQVANFANGKAAIMPEGNWVAPNLEQLGMDTTQVSIIPEMYNEESSGQLAAGASCYWVVNKNGDTEAATQFLNDLVMTDAGQKYTAETAQMISPFENNPYTPSDGLSQDTARYIEEGNTAPRYNYLEPTGFSTDVLGPVYQLYGTNGDTQAFIDGIMNSAPKGE